MNKSAFLLAIGSILFVSGCDKAGGGADKRIANLEREVAGARDENRDLRVKLRLAEPFSQHSPLGDFFASPEFWQCTYDSSWSDCSSRCAGNAETERAECAKIANKTRQANCYSEASATVAMCVKACPVKMSPLNPPRCRGGVPS